MARKICLTRRSILQRAGWIFASGAFPFLGAPFVHSLFAIPAAAVPQTRADYPVSDVMKRLSSYMCQARDNALPDDVVDRAKLHILDTFAAMV